MENECKNVWEIAEGPSICLDESAVEEPETAEKSWHGIKAFVEKPFYDVLSLVREAIPELGMQQVFEINVREMLQEEMRTDFPHYSVLGMVKAEWVNRVLEIDPDLGTSISTNVVIYEQDNGIVISASNPFASPKSEELIGISCEIRGALQEIVDRVTQT